MRIGLYGGAFNPVHCEHVRVAQAAVEALQLDKLIIIPTHISPHKRGDIMARGHERREMCERAFSCIPCAEVSGTELKRKGVSYSYVTCRHFKEKYPDDELFFIMGADMLECFADWKEPEEILKCVTLAVAGREGEKDLGGIIEAFRERFPGNEVMQVGYTGSKVSSTRVRVLAALGEDLGDLVPEKVNKYINRHNVYLMPNVASCRQYIKEKRWKHSVRVAILAAENCRRLGIFEEDAVIAGGLHDCAKYTSLDSPDLKGFVCPPDVPEPVLHQFTGAYMAEHVFGITDENILDAIRYHTSGREDMSPLEKLLFLADMLEEGRDFEGVEHLREVFKQDLDRCLYESLKQQVAYLQSTGKPVYPLTERAYEYIKEKYEQ
ncbi:MAG: nicotinate (nicotinamide) nucleotide adenylyltransferase [Clostridia bacterium]|nr:nicotinate (nicotinamide) nucleotide adenylyltransferase [Clostridia bacterium]